jgi:hypothetical protein
MPDTKELSLRQKREMFQRLRGTKAADDVIIPCNRKENLPVSFMQEQIIRAEVIGLYDPHKIKVNSPALSYLIKGSLNISVLDKALCEVLRRHEILRSGYSVVDQTIFQHVKDVPKSILRVHDLKNLPSGDRERETERILKEIATDATSFFEDRLMIDATVITGGSEHILIVTVNHVAVDGLSMMILQSELFLLYQAYFYNTPSPLPELPIQYADFAIWEREHFSSDFLEGKLAYWKQLPHGLFKTMLPVDHISESLSYAGDIVPVTILPELTKRLLQLGHKCNVTLFTVLFAAFISLIHAFSGHRYNFFCMPVANRSRKEIRPSIGCFMNLQFVYIDLEGNPTFQELLERLNKTLMDVYDNYVPFHFISQQIPPQGPVVDFQLLASPDAPASAVPREDQTTAEETSFIGSDPQVPAPSLKDVVDAETQTAPRNMRHTTSELALLPFKLQQQEFALFPIDVYLSGFSETITGHFKYQTATYDRKTVAKLVNDYIVLLTKIVRNADIRIDETGIKPHGSVPAIE